LVIRDAEKVGAPALLRPKDLASGNVKLNTVFVSALFNAKHGLEELTAEEYEAAQIIDDDIEGTREERAFRFWINSLNIDDLYVTDLYEECKDGILLLKVISKLSPEAVDWKVVEKNPNNKFKMSSNGG